MALGDLSWGSSSPESALLEVRVRDLGDCQNYGPLLGPYYNTGPNTGPKLGDSKRDHNVDNPPFGANEGSRSPELHPLICTSESPGRLLKIPCSSV